MTKSKTEMIAATATLQMARQATQAIDHDQSTSNTAGHATQDSGA